MELPCPYFTTLSSWAWRFASLSVLSRGSKVVVTSWFGVVEGNGICGFREPGSGRIKPLRAALEGDPVLKGLADGGDSVFSFEEDASSGEQFIVVCSGDPEGLFGRRIPVSKG